MVQFKVFRHPAGQVLAVKQGWSWPAFLFGCFWAMAVKMWALGLGLLLGSFMLGVVLAVADAGDGAQIMVNIATLVLSIIFGVNGNTWRERHLLSRGFELKDTVSATNRDGAIALFIKGAAPARG